MKSVSKETQSPCTSENVFILPSHLTEIFSGDKIETRLEYSREGGTGKNCRDSGRDKRGMGEAGKEEEITA